MISLGFAMADEKKSRWKFPLGLMATGVAGAAVLVLRGCWHRKMSWPVRYQEHSYQVCLGCGIKRLFDEKLFRAYGPYSYDLNRLVSWDTRTTNVTAVARSSWLRFDNGVLSPACRVRAGNAPHAPSLSAANAPFSGLRKA